ncbi:MAG: hypothetical protein JNK38_16095 [Acidobacteria bacterium]|nr:hypothetical protein [Acidobacteriota bacterium]
MNYKPSDLFVGIVDFFSVLLPGAVLAFALQLAKVGFIESQLAGLSSQTKWIVFVIASYLLGHFVFLIGAAFLDHLYDATYVKRQQAKRGARLLKHAASIKRAALQDAHKIENHFKWARAFIKLKKPEMAADIDRLEADSKFFRSLTVVAGAGWILIGYYTQSFTALLLSASVILLWEIRLYTPAPKWKKKHPRLQAARRMFKRLKRLKLILIYLFGAVLALVSGAILWEGTWRLTVGCFALLCLSSWRYADQRWKMTQTAYLYFVLLNQPEKTAPSRPAIPQFEV